MIKLSKTRKFEIGDRVRVISDCKTQGKVGIVTNYNESEYSRIRWVTVQLDGCENKHIYNEMSLIKEDESEVHNIVALTGNFKIARVQFLYGYNKDKIYNFALFDNDIVEGDFVLCDTQNGYHVAKVVGIEIKSVGVTVTKEIVCKVDFSKFEHRKEVRKQKVELKTKLDKAIRENQDLILYETVAKSNAQVAELLAQYKALLGES